MKNLSLYLAKQYINNFYEVFFKNVKDQEQLKKIKEAKKQVHKYEDVGFLKDVFESDLMDYHKSAYEAQKEENIRRCTSLINDIDKFYEEHFQGKEIIDVKVINKELDTLNKKLLAVNNQYYFGDIAPLYEVKNNLSVELNLYVDKHKSEEYMDMSIFHQSVTSILKHTKDIINELIKEMENDEDFVSSYINALKTNFSIIFDSASSKTTSIPNWAKGLLFCSPWIIGFLVFTLYPLIRTMIFSFSDVNLTPQGFSTTNVGFTNYKNVIGDSTFRDLIVQYLVEMLVYVPLITVFSLILAMLLNTKIKGKGFFRTLFFFPVIITSGPVITKLIELQITAMPGIQALNIDAFIATLPSFLGKILTIMTSEFILILWYSGIQILVFLTALQKIDKGVYEASAIDGASKWEQFWKVTLPAINPSIVINVVFTVVMQSIFALSPIIEQIQRSQNMTSEGAGYGYASAMAYLYFIIIIVVLVIYVLIFMRHEKKSKERR